MPENDTVSRLYFMIFSVLLKALIKTTRAWFGH